MASYPTVKTSASEASWTHAVGVTAPALVLAPTSFIADIRAKFQVEGLSDAITLHDSARLFDWLALHIGLQGISDAAAYRYAAQHGNATFEAVHTNLASEPSCPRLRSFWHFEDCRYRKAARTCSEPLHRPCCPLPTLPLRKGSLNGAAYSLVLFFRDVCDGDFVGWIDRRLVEADLGLGAPGRGPRLRDTVLGPLQGIGGVGPKLLAMLLADLLLASDPARERWVTAGAWMIAVDSLTHNFLHRTGVLARFEAEHRYGPACYDPGGCASVIEGLARRIDARTYNDAYPAVFPRFVQAAIWSFCAEGSLNICNGNKIDDRHRCDQRYCPAFRTCDRKQLHSSEPVDRLPPSIL